MVTQFAAKVPLTTMEITEFCQSRNPSLPGITTQRVSEMLHWLHQKRRIDTWSGSETDALTARGVREPQQRMRYWALPERTGP